MSYGLIDDDLWYNAKARSFKPTEGWLWVLCISWVRKHSKASGYISREDALIVAALHKIASGGAVLDSLIEKHGLDPIGDSGYVIHGYAEMYDKSAAGGRARASGAVRDAGRFTSDPPAPPPAAPPATDQQGHQPPSPSPTPSPSLVSLKDLRERAIGRGVDQEGLAFRLDDLRQLAERKGARNWIRYVLTGYRGAASLFDQHVSRWLEEDHEQRKQVEREAPDFGVRLRRVEPA